MSTLNENLTTGFNTVKRLRPLLKDPAFWQDLLTQLRSPNSKNLPNYWDININGPWPPSLQSVLERTNAFPSYATIIGICNDGLPFLLDLTNPAPGSILITGDRGSGKSQLLRAILKSIIKLNPISRVEINLITDNPEAYQDSFGEMFKHKIIHHSEQASIDLIEKLAEITDDRRRSRPQDPAIILAITDLAKLTRALDHQVFATLYWLIKHGPRSRIWPVASIHADQTPNIDSRLLEAFRTRLIGHIQNRNLATAITNDRRLDANKLKNGVQFFVPYGDEWIPFWICDPD